MASYTPVVKNGTNGCILYTGLIDQSNTKLLKSTPTLAAGDFKVSIDGGALANLNTLPTVTPAAGRQIKITLSQAEVNGDNITIQCVDAAGAEWCDQLINIQTVARQFDDLAFPATSGRSIVVDASGLVDANTVKLGPTGSGTAQTARDIGTSVLLSTGTGTGQLDFTSGVVKANLAQILGTALTETAGLLAGGFKKFFNVATPTGTLNSIPDAVPDASGGLPVTGNRLTAIPTIATVTTVTNQLTAAAIATGVWQDATAGDFTTASSIGKALYVSNVAPGAAGGHFIAGTNAATTITTGLTTTFTGNLTGSVASVTAGVTLAASAVQAVWDSLTSALTTVGSVGKRIADFLTGDAYVRLGAPAGASTAADIAAVKTDSAAVKVQTDKLAFTVPNQVDANVLDWKSSTAPAMTGDAFARLGAPAGASVSADVAAVKVDSAAVKAKTDSLTFTVPTILDANVQAVNDVTVNGVGSAGNPWGP